MTFEAIADVERRFNGLEGAGEEAGIVGALVIDGDMANSGFGVCLPLCDDGGFDDDLEEDC